MSVTYNQSMLCRRNFQEDNCLGCINLKERGKSFCSACLASLPAKLKREFCRPEYLQVDATHYAEVFFEALALAKERTYGYEVTIDVRNGIVGREELKFRSKGNPTTAIRAAKLKRGFIEVLHLEPFTSEQWVRAFGHGRM